MSETLSLDGMYDIRDFLQQWGFCVCVRRLGSKNSDRNSGAKLSRGVSRGGSCSLSSLRSAFLSAIGPTSCAFFVDGSSAMPTPPGSARTLHLDPFRPTFSSDQLADLHRAIEAARLPAETYASRQSKYGVTHEWMRKALERWTGGFDWCVWPQPHIAYPEEDLILGFDSHTDSEPTHRSQHEREINEVDHYKVKVTSRGVEHEVRFLTGLRSWARRACTGLTRPSTT